MNLTFLEQLSNADAIASHENEVREVLKQELTSYADDIITDGLGSIIFKKKSKKAALKIMVLAHMDEVGFIIKHIRTDGLLELIPVGNVHPLAQYAQHVSITTCTGKKIAAILISKQENNSITSLCADVGATTSQQIIDLGVEIGDMVTYSSAFKQMDINKIIAGKAFDNRLGCFIMGEVLKNLKNLTVDNELYFAATSSEEVGLRGAKTAVQLINPDVIFVIDVVSFSELFYSDEHNHRQMGQGVILIHFDKTFCPNPKMLQYVKDSAFSLQLKLQYDMLNSGGTDAGEAHKVNEGKPTVVTCLGLRYCHGAWSMASLADVDDAITLYTHMLQFFNIDNYNNILKF